MRKILLVIDMQNDFIDGALGTKEAEGIVDRVLAKMDAYPPEDIYATRDTHPDNYLELQEGKYLPVPHCIRGSFGWQLRDKIAAKIPKDHVIDKPTFGSLTLAEEMKKIYEAENGEAEFEFIGICTDICVVSNALILKATLPEAKISADASCCAGVSPAKHEAALETMRSCQIEIR